MASGFQQTFDVQQSLQPRRDSHNPVGFLNSFALGDTTLDSDLRVVDPAGTPALVAPVGTTQVVAVLADIAWFGSATGNITLAALISPAGAERLNSYLAQTVRKNVVAISFVAFSYDANRERYYTACKSYQGAAPPGAPTGAGPGPGDARPIFGSIATRGTKPSLVVDPEPMVLPGTSAKCFMFQVELAPIATAEPQLIQTQRSEADKLMHRWGLPAS